MNLKNKLGKRIKELRKNKRLSQEKLSEMIDIAQNTLSGIENGDNFCTAETLEKIIIALEIEPLELFDFGHQKDNETLLIEINNMLKNTPEKIPEVYKIIKAIIN
ncbi:TPA: helix-turn-helix transcriptional regulator [Candidatus Scatousia excrementigallinarum]|uniref:Helix-turn-helix transcriptional regulator n=1 Tax=Candidatus Scatousia excrementigallinarum TaxID=2840935 RepID=A0A9D1JMQ8_9BACT|nr:helix-turn-helix transcriptional regulator [Candidatus Scatousia excrementigallinarum]